MPSFIDSLAKNIFQKATVVYKQQVASHVYHIKLQSDALSSHHYIPGEHMRLFVGLDRDTALDSKLRTYSVWDYESSRDMVDLAVCTHSTGIGATWIRQVQEGDAIHYMGPKGKLVIDFNADSSLMICDPSALSHMYAIKKHIAPGKANAGITYSEDASDHYADLDGSHPFQFLQLEFDPTERIIEAANAFKSKLTGRTTIYLGGDARVCKSLSRYFRQNWPQATVNSKGFWMPGKTGMD
jgi:NADPH-dependent ferric siderophore reductase